MSSPFEKAELECYAKYTSSNYTAVEPGNHCKVEEDTQRLIEGEAFCNTTFDSYLCWPPTAPGNVVSQNCPPIRNSNISSLAFRTCSNEGQWQGRTPNDTLGFTNYAPCFPTEAVLNIAQNTRYVELGGYTVSLLALLLSLFIFSYYRSLQNTRTSIHKNLFTALAMHAFMKMIIYIDEARTQSSVADTLNNIADVYVRGIHNLRYICEGFYVMLEYVVMSTFMWMLIEGWYLYRLVGGNVVLDDVLPIFYALGWGVPVIVTGIWATVTAYSFKSDIIDSCWYGYFSSSQYWILHAPHLAIVAINVFFLINIMSVLVSKLNKSECSKGEKVWKTVRAALILLPVLGITKILNMAEEGPLNRSDWVFAIWSYSTHFLRSFEGFILALIFCYCSEPVHKVLRQHYENYIAFRGGPRRRRSRRSRRSQRVHSWQFFPNDWERRTFPYPHETIQFDLSSIRCDENHLVACDACHHMALLANLNLAGPSTSQRMQHRVAETAKTEESDPSVEIEMTEMKTHRDEDDFKLQSAINVDLKINGEEKELEMVTDCEPHESVEPGNSNQRKTCTEDTSPEQRSEATLTCVMVHRPDEP